MTCFYHACFIACKMYTKHMLLVSFEAMLWLSRLYLHHHNMYLIKSTNLCEVLSHISDVITLLFNLLRFYYKYPLNIEYTFKEKSWVLTLSSVLALDGGWYYQNMTYISLDLYCLTFVLITFYRHAVCNTKHVETIGALSSRRWHLVFHL